MNLINWVSQQIPGLPISYIEIAVIIVGVMGALILMYGVLLEAERRQDAVFVVGAAALFVYGLAHGDYVIIFAMGGMFLIAGRELIQIMRGRHHHGIIDVQEYEHPENK